MILTRKTSKFLCVRAEIARSELTVEAQKIYDLYTDPNVGPEQKEIAKKELDAMIKKLENRVDTAKRLKGDQKKG